MYIHMFVCNLTPWNVETPVFRKADGFFDPTSTWTVQNYADTRMPLMQDCLAPLIDSTTRHYSTCSTYTHSTSLRLAFLASVQQGRALEHGFIVLNSVSMHAYWKYTRNLWNMDTSIFQTHKRWVLWCPHHMVVMESMIKCICNQLNQVLHSLSNCACVQDHSWVIHS